MPKMVQRSIDEDIFIFQPRSTVLVTAKKAAQKGSNNAFDQAQLASAAKPQSARVIKKYPNRRLYDTNSSAYITLAQVKQFVVEGKPFVVRDAKTADDLTRSILLQIILEEEMGGVPLFSEAALANMIRFYGHAMQGFMGQMLEKNMQSFMDMQAQLSAQSALPGLAGVAGVPTMSQLMGHFLEQSQGLASQAQEQMLAAFGMKR